MKAEYSSPVRTLARQREGLEGLQSGSGAIRKSTVISFFVPIAPSAALGVFNP
jgi:hypothetical protein